VATAPPKSLDVETTVPEDLLYVKILYVKAPTGAGGSPDEVDQLLEDWRRERPELDVSPLAVMSRIFRLGRRLDHERKAVFDQFGLEGWSFDVLAALRRARAPHELAPRALLRETLVSSGAMTNRIDRLEDARLVVRGPDPHDRRGVLVRLTPSGRRRVDACLAGLAAREHELLAPLDTRQRSQLADLLRALLLPLDAPPHDA
jgi:DNA-binding MarR family transcriptional regulator